MEVNYIEIITGGTKNSFQGKGQCNCYVL